VKALSHRQRGDHVKTATMLVVSVAIAGGVGLGMPVWFTGTTTVCDDDPHHSAIERQFDRKDPVLLTASGMPDSVRAVLAGDREDRVEGIAGWQQAGDPAPDLANLVFGPWKLASPLRKTAGCGDRVLCQSTGSSGGIGAGR
jgi:hypothetical protein